jgi:monothiol glutaredoxin
MDGDGTVFGNKHEKPPDFEGLIIGSSGAFPDNRALTAFSRIFRLGASMSDTQQRIDTLVKSNDVVLFMKGTASFPQCGFSGRAIQILKGCGLDGKTIATVNVLEDQEVRQGIKEYSNWPTIPQLYVKGEFIGGSDIMTEMYESGELQKVIAGEAA